MKNKSVPNTSDCPKAMGFNSGLYRRERKGENHVGDDKIDSVKKRRDSSAKPDPQDRIAPEFINITNSFSLNSNSRTSVRAQVMRDYHRRRIQKRVNRRSSSPTLNSTPIPLSAKEQTLKFRFDEGKKDQILGRNARRIRKLAPRTANSIRPLEVAGDAGLPNEGHVDESQTLLQNRRQSRISNGDSLEEQIPEMPFDKIERLFSHMKISVLLPTLYDSVAPGVMDPFSSMSLLITPRTQLLLHHYFNIRLHTSWLMMPMRKGLFAMALHDAALFHTFMSHYVASYQLRHGKGDPAESLQHRTEAIRIVNARLQDPGLALTDSTIAAVANIAVYESTNGSTESMRVHLKGLNEMIRMRGGIVHGGFTAQVRRLIAWTDLHCASASSERPIFHPLCFPNPDEPPDLPFETLGPNLIESSVCEDREIYNYSVGGHPLEWILKHIKDLSTILEAVRTSSVLPDENVRYSDKVYYLHHCLLATIYSPNYNQLDTVFAISVLIFCCACFRDVSFNFKVIFDGVKRLWDELQELDMDYILLDSVSSIRLFWTVTMGAVAAEGKAERHGLLEMVKIMGAVLNLGTWESARITLKEVLWQDQLDQFGHRLWREEMY